MTVVLPWLLSQLTESHDQASVNNVLTVAYHKERMHVVNSVLQAK